MTSPQKYSLIWTRVTYTNSKSTEGMKRANRLASLKHKAFNIFVSFFLAHSKFLIITLCFIERCEKYFVLSRNKILHGESISSLQLVKTTVK